MTLEPSDDARLLQFALSALEYYREMTRPMTQTDEVIVLLRKRLEGGSSASQPSPGVPAPGQVYDSMVDDFGE